MPDPVQAGILADGVYRVFDLRTVLTAGEFGTGLPIYAARCGSELWESPNNKHIVEPLGFSRSLPVPEAGVELAPPFDPEEAAGVAPSFETGLTFAKLYATRACTSLREPPQDNIHLAVPEALGRTHAGYPVHFSSCHRCRQLRCRCRAQLSFGWPEFGQAVFSGPFRGLPQQLFLDLLPRRWSLPVNLSPPGFPGEIRVVSSFGPCPFPREVPYTCFTGLMNDFSLPDGMLWRRPMVGLVTSAFADFAGTSVSMNLIPGYFFQVSPGEVYFYPIEEFIPPFTRRPVILAAYYVLWPLGSPESSCVLPRTFVDPRFLASAPDSVSIGLAEFIGSEPACGLPKPSGYVGQWLPQSLPFTVERRSSTCANLNKLSGQLRPYPYDQFGPDWFVYAASSGYVPTYLAIVPIPETPAYFWLWFRCSGCGYGPDDYDVRAAIFARDQIIPGIFEGGLLDVTSHLYAISRPLGEGASRMIVASASPLFLQYELDMVSLRAPFGCSGPIRVSIVV